jgi:hypothetical protein
MKCLAKHDQRIATRVLAGCPDPGAVPASERRAHPVGTTGVALGRRRWLIALTAAAAPAVIGFLLLARNQPPRAADGDRAGSAPPASSGSIRCSLQMGACSPMRRVSTARCESSSPGQRRRSDHGGTGRQRQSALAPVGASGARIAFRSGLDHSVPSLGGSADAIVEGPATAPVSGFDWSPDGSIVVLGRGAPVRRRTRPVHPTELLRDARGIRWRGANGAGSRSSRNTDSSSARRCSATWRVAAHVNWFPRRAAPPCPHRWPRARRGSPGSIVAPCCSSRAGDSDLPRIP